jgi:hypothetical protein
MKGSDRDVEVFRQQNNFPNNLLFVIESLSTRFIPSKQMRHNHSSVP